MKQDAVEPARRMNAHEALALLRRCRPGGADVRCPRCGNTRLYVLRDSRYRCPECGYTFGEFCGTWLAKVKMPPEYWVAVINSFVSGFSVEDIAARLGLAYATVFRACQLVRLAIVSHGPDGKELLGPDGQVMTFCPNMQDESRQLACNECRSPVFGVREDSTGISQGRVALRLLTKARARDMFGHPLPLKSWRGFVYTGPFKEHAGLIFSCCRTARRVYSEKFVTDALPLDRPGGFREFAEGWLARYRCPAPQTACLYLREIEVRFNHQFEDLTPILAKMVLRQVSKHGE